MIFLTLPILGPTLWIRMLAYLSTRSKTFWVLQLKYEVPLKISLLQIAQVRRHSLQMAPESSHPSSHGRGPSYRFLRATYTAGSMAGLGFSMAILGVCIGLFLGFLLWKRRLGVPYQLSPWRSDLVREMSYSIGYYIALLGATWYSVYYRLPKGPM